MQNSQPFGRELNAEAKNICLAVKQLINEARHHASQKDWPFSAKERVLVPHTDKMYEAKIMKCEKRGEMWFYFIHYQGWGKKWDEWVEAPGLFKFDPAKKAAPPAEFIDPAAAIGEDDADAAAESLELTSDAAEAPGAKRKSVGPAIRPDQKRRKANDIASQDVVLPNEAAEFAVEVRLTADLKQVLCDEYDAGQQAGMASGLPCTPSVAEILLQYVESERGFRHSTDVQEQFVSGLRTYFDKAIHNSLLYDHEIEPCRKVLSGGIMPSSQYGALHLLRLLYKLPALIPITASSADGFAALQDQLMTFVLFLNARHTELFGKAASTV